MGWARAVLKPRIAATAYGTFLIDARTTLSDEDLAPARASGAVIQEFIPEFVERGEVAMIFAGGTFSHAVSRRATAGDFRVQKDFGGVVEPLAPSAELLAFGAAVMAQVLASCAYARVDVVETERGPLLMELELVEPELYFSIIPGSADLLARVIVQRLAEL